MRVEIAVSHEHSPVLAHRLHEAGIEPDIQHRPRENHLCVETEMNVVALLDGLEAVIIPNPPEGFEPIQ